MADAHVGGCDDPVNARQDQQPRQFDRLLRISWTVIDSRQEMAVEVNEGHPVERYPSRPRPGRSRGLACPDSVRYCRNLVIESGRYGLGGIFRGVVVKLPHDPV